MLIFSNFNKIFRKIAIVFLVGLVALTGVAITPAQANPIEAAKERILEGNAENAAKAQEAADDYIESGRRAAEVIPQELGTGSRQKNPVNMLKRAGEELGNDLPKRVVGANDYDRSQVEQELARNKAKRGDFGS
ncbi:MAG: hypothetical protein IGS39_19815 [Calothrix sp. C42_A2020_038]|nr:hypothetical protein [Calothrix sp. C42_A2020_038]